MSATKPPTPPAPPLADAASTAPAPGARRRLVMLWDAPNIDMAITNLVAGKPHAGQRPDFFALGAWLVARAESYAARDGAAWEVDAVVFTNVPAATADKIRPWVEVIRHAGFAVFVKPKAGDSDIDPDILAAIATAEASGDLGEVLVASGDRRAFQQPLSALAAAGVAATYLGFAEFAGNQDAVAFIDLEEVPGLFSVPLPRTDLAHLPAAGVLLPPIGKIGTVQRRPARAGRRLEPRPSEGTDAVVEDDVDDNPKLQDLLRPDAPTLRRPRRRT